MYLVLTIHMQFTYPVATQVPYLLTYYIIIITIYIHNCAMVVILATCNS
jgi:hypothetical protein